METQNQINYTRVAEVIEYVRTNFKFYPNLEEVAKKANLSPTHFQKIFTDWAEINPEKFLQYISAEHVKKILKEKQATLFDVALEAKSSSTNRSHDLFINMERMTSTEYKNDGINLQINYSFTESLFGNLIVASTSKGVCYMAFEDDEMSGFQNLQAKFLNATFQKKFDLIQQNALSIFQNDWHQINEIKLHIKGTDFQLKVWEKLLKIPMGELSTYGKLARKIDNPNASRAVGTAIGSNPVAYLIPCHRVVQSTGDFGGYMWGKTRKAAIIGWESTKTYS